MHSAWIGWPGHYFRPPHFPPRSGYVKDLATRGD